MSYLIQFRTCKDNVGSTPAPAGLEHERWATYADLLLMGEDLKVDLPGQRGDEHIDTVVLAYAPPDEAPFMVASVSLCCPCAGPIDRARTAKSELYTPPKPQLHLPR